MVQRIKTSCFVSVFPLICLFLIGQVWSAPLSIRSMTYKLVDTPVQYKQAAKECKKLGMELVQVRTSNWREVVTVENHGQQAWIASWNGDNYRGACLAMTNSGISIPAAGCDIKLPFVCAQLSKSSSDKKRDKRRRSKGGTSAAKRSLKANVPLLPRSRVDRQVRLQKRGAADDESLFSSTDNQPRDKLLVLNL